MKKRVSKVSQELYNKQMELVIPIFEDYFTNYYSQNRLIKSYSFYNMKDMAGFSAVLEYDNFRQYVNYHIGKGLFGENTINTCFELEFNGNKFLCHFVDILNEVDSDDLSFYTYDNCLIKEDIETALNGIMEATNKYYSEISSIAVSQNRVKSIYDNYASDEYDGSLAEIEEAADFDYIFYGNKTSYDELSKQLAVEFKKGRLDEGYPKRAYRVLNNMSRSQLKKAEKERTVKSKLPLSAKIIMSIPYVVFAVVFAVIFAVAFRYIDAQIYSECVARSSSSDITVFVGVFLGAVAGVVFFSFFPPKTYKLIAKGKTYEQIEQTLYSSATDSPLAYVTIVGGCLLIFAFFICMFSFNGAGFTENSVIYKEYVFSQKQEYSFEDMKICEIEATYDDGDYHEYIGTAYAFKFDDEWYDFGVPNDEEMQIIQNNIKKYNIKVDKAYSVDSIGKGQ
ncbi:MAG: hypothetical protein J1E81_09235 [Eubacterium sp.]|nr:hypothetical protein [Eubacterium sp.]